MQDLLDMLAFRVGAAYLSDLSRSGRRQDIARIVDTIPYGMYPLGQWTEAVRYITGHYTLTPASEAEARMLLRNGR